MNLYREKNERNVQRKQQNKCLDLWTFTGDPTSVEHTGRLQAPVQGMYGLHAFV